MVKTEVGRRVSASRYLRQPGTSLESLLSSGQISLEIDPDLSSADIDSLQTTVKYSGYLKQEASRAARMQREERRRIPPQFEFANIPGLSREVVQRLRQVRPETLAQAGRIPGVTPAAVAVLGAFLDRGIRPGIGSEAMNSHGD